MNNPETLKELREIASFVLPEVLEIRRHLHKYPELSFQEFETFSYLSTSLKKHDIRFRQAGETGIIGELKGRKPEKRTILLRADIDALPIEENTTLPFASKTKGVMHACGHDVHSATLFGTLLILKHLQNSWEGTVRFVFQPGEEKLPGGALKMIEEGVLENPTPSLILAQHIYPELPAGNVGFCPGPYMASADEIYFDVMGKGGHAAQPERTSNPVWVAAKLLDALHDLHLSFQNKHCLLSIGKVDAPGATNIIPEWVHMEGTVRTFDETVRKQLHREIGSIAERLSNKYDILIKPEIRKGFPPLSNDPEITNNARLIAIDLIGKENVASINPRLTSEDFSWYGQQVPLCFYRLGTAFPGNESAPGLHTSTLNVNEDAIRTGLLLFAALAMNL